MPETNARIKVCHDTAANFKTNNPTLLVGEWALETDTKKMKIGDGVTAYNSLQYSTAEDSEVWQKPSDWIDIRSGALENSVYFLVGHSADYSLYPTFALNAEISNSGTYDVYVDGVKQASAVASGSTATFTWQTLALSTGYDVTYPSALRTHVIRVTPSVSTNTITRIYTDGTGELGVLWVHFSINNRVSLNYFLGNNNGSKSCPICEAVTAEGDTILLSSSNINYAFKFASSLQETPTLDGNNNSAEASDCFRGCSKLKTIMLKNISIYGVAIFFGCSILKNIKCEHAFVQYADSSYKNCVSLEGIPQTKNVNNLSFVQSIPGVFSGCTSLNPLFLDLTTYANKKLIRLGGTSTNPLNVKGVIVSSYAPFAGASPQLDVSYTGLDRAALVNLFKSMPSVHSYVIVGSPTISNGIVSDFTTSDFIRFRPMNISYEGLKIRMYFTVNTALAETQTLFNTQKSGGAKKCTVSLLTSSSRDFRIRLGATGGTELWDSNLHLSAGTEYYAEAKISATDIKFTVGTDEGGVLYSGSASTTNFASETCYTCDIGKYAEGNPFTNGSINIGKSYVYSNGLPWSATDGITRTCSIVGCTGTADLTTADKAVAENKGWELVLS